MRRRCSRGEVRCARGVRLELGKLDRELEGPSRYGRGRGKIRGTAPPSVSWTTLSRSTEKQFGSMAPMGILPWPLKKESIGFGGGWVVVCDVVCECLLLVGVVETWIGNLVMGFRSPLAMVRATSASTCAPIYGISSDVRDPSSGLR